MILPESSMTPAAAKRASAMLADLWARGETIETLPSALRPLGWADGYAIQQWLELQSDAPLFGWKIAATSAAGQAHIAVDGPLAGRLLRDRVVPAGVLCPFGANRMKVAELEFAFRLGRDLPQRHGDYDIAEVLDAVDTLHPAIEIPDSRFAPFDRAGGAQLIADNACANYFVLGDAAPASWRSIDLADHMVMGRIGNGPPHFGTGRNVLGDPRLALTWIANELSRLGIGLRAGQVVTTGTCVTPMAIEPGDQISGDFGALGIVAVTMSSL